MKTAETCDRWNPAHFGDAPRRCEPNGQMTIFFDIDEPPDPDDYQSLEEYEIAWQEWESKQGANNSQITTPILRRITNV